jgi:hypothetical protein
MITSLKLNEIFVFGSNLAGRHGRGAALQAAKDFGAKYGIGEGLTGQCYAFPTLTQSFKQRTRSSLERSRDLLYDCCENHPRLTFLLTKVGCGLGGYNEEDMMSLFKDPPDNLILPEEWKEFWSLVDL